ncbi:hypothetical protein LY90DRAFT_302423, partial [Neocallimastix californiae]
LCPEGECCSQYGYCGTTSAHCENTLGCQTEYGSCYASTAKGKCGKDYGRCPKPYHCCSKSGYCGEGDDYCGTGCQSAYGLCGDEQMEVEEAVEWVTEVVTEYKCDNDKCCSKYGYCGTTDAYCSVSKGCQIKYGDCYEVVDTASVASVASDASVLDTPECGKGIGSCIDGECCNSEGYCGISDDHCSIDKGCQKEFGVCNSQSGVGECGENFGRCPNAEHCCSKMGFCGASDDYCSLKKGCQPEYGLCIDDQNEDVYEVDGDNQNEEQETQTTTTANPVDPECGEGIGSCPNGGCCSAEGLCGTTAAFCSVENGCQKAFGLC